MASLIEDTLTNGPITTKNYYNSYQNVSIVSVKRKT